MRQKRRGSLAQGILVIVVLLVFVMVLLPNHRGSRTGPWLFKACYANMRVLLGAIEMYNLDHREAFPREISLNSTLQNDYLMKGKYLKAEVICPKGLIPSPTLRVAKVESFLAETVFPITLLHGPFLRMMGYRLAPAPGEYFLSSQTEVLCNLHGKLP